MIVVLLTWLSIFFIFFSFGDCFVMVFNKLTKRAECYSIVDTFILGMCFTLIPLSITSLWLPSNHYMMFSYIVLGVVYWIVRKAYFNLKFSGFISKLSALSIRNRFFFVLPFIIFLFCALWQSHASDGPGYHYQLTHWNEAYGVVPGIANLEDRMGFNSNYSLLSAIFTFRFLTGDQHFLIQSLLAALIVSQTIYRCFQSKFDIRHIILLFIWLLYFWSSYYNLNNSSTDALPALCLFYMLSKYLINNKEIRKEYLFAFFVPVALVTTKLSVTPILLLGLYCLYSLFKNRDRNTIVTLIILAFLVVIPWLIRNVIISGYLVFPLYQLDLFSYDWKVPEYVAIKQSNWIRNYPWLAFKNTANFLNEFVANGGIASEKTLFMNVIHQILVCGLVLMSPIIVCISYFKKNRLDCTIYLLYIIMVIYILYSLLSAPDFRFIAGVAYAILFLEVCILFKLDQRIKHLSTSKGSLCITFFLIFLTIVVGKELYNGYLIVQEDACHEERPFNTVLYAPYTAKARAKLVFEPYQMGNVIVYISTKVPWFPYDQLPASAAPSDFKYEPIETIEARGDKLEDGFRPKPLVDHK